MMRRQSGLSLLELSIALALLVVVIASTMRFTQYFFATSESTSEASALEYLLKQKIEEIQTLGFWVWDVDINNPKFPGNPYDPSVKWANELTDWNIESATIEVTFLKEVTGPPNSNLPPFLQKLNWVYPETIVTQEDTQVPTENPKTFSAALYLDAASVTGSIQTARDQVITSQSDIDKFPNNRNKLQTAANDAATSAESIAAHIVSTNLTITQTLQSLNDALGYAPASIHPDINAAISSTNLYIISLTSPSDNAVAASIQARNASNSAASESNPNLVRTYTQFAVNKTTETADEGDLYISPLLEIASIADTIGDLIIASVGGPSPTGHDKFLMDQQLSTLLPLDVEAFLGPEFDVTQNARTLVQLDFNIQSKAGDSASQSIMLSMVPTSKKLKGLTYIIQQALKQYYHETGSYPPSNNNDGLEYLVPSYLAEIPNDPYTFLKPQITHKEEVTDWSYRHDPVSQTIYLFPYSKPNFSHNSHLVQWTY